MRRFRLFGQTQPDPAAPGETVSRLRRTRTRRHLIGLWLNRWSGELQGAVLTTRGCGRWIEYEPNIGESWPLSPSLLTELRRIEGHADPSHLDCESLATDLADWAAILCGQLIDRLGPLDDELLAACIHDDGWRLVDFDQRPAYLPWLNASRLAELCGLSVISNLRQADLAAGGTGDPLEPLAWWFLLGDRSSRTAASSRVVLNLDHPAGLVYLPASDGLDAAHPLVDYLPLPIWPIVGRSLQKHARMQPDLAHLGTLAVQGKPLPDLLAWLDDSLAPSPAPAQGGSLREAPEHVITRLASDANGTAADIARTAMQWLADQTCRMARRSRKDAPAVDQIILAGSGSNDGYLQHLLREQLPEIRVQRVEAAGWDSRWLNATLTAVLGVMHIDQQPASLPWLTGAEIPRLHGVLAPGSLAAWRRLLIEMADYRPPPMRLREAI